MTSRKEVMDLIKKLPISEDDQIFQKLYDMISGEALSVLSRLEPKLLLALLCKAHEISKETPESNKVVVGPVSPQSDPAPIKVQPTMESDPAPIKVQPTMESVEPGVDNTPLDLPPDSSSDSLPDLPPDSPQFESIPQIGTPEWYVWKKQQRQEWESTKDKKSDG